MNTLEANAFNTLLKGMTPGASDDTMHAALEAADFLGRAAHAVLVGVDGVQAREIADRNFTVLVWGDEDAAGIGIARRVETHEPVDGVL